MNFLLNSLGIKTRSYLDIGGHHPIRYSNTYLFYLAGASGVVVEPNPKWYARHRKVRPRDIALNAGLGGETRTGVPFFQMRSDTLSTFSREEAERMVRECREQIVRETPIDILTPQEVIGSHFKEGPDFVSLDVEGLELDILRTFDFDLHRPAAFCIETLSFASDGSGKKNTEIPEYMDKQGYKVYADTWINTVFVDRVRWERFAN